MCACRARHLDAESHVVGTVGLLKEQKGHTYLLQAAERLAERRDDIQWLIVGDGELRAGLEAEARLRGLARARALPRPARRRAGDPRRARRLRAVVDYEGMCFAVAEALAVEVPVVATDVGGVGQSVVDGETGLLVAPRDPAALAQAIERLWTTATRRPASAARDAARRAVVRLSEMAAATARLYERVLAE